MTQIRRISFAPVVQQLMPHPPETKEIKVKKDTVRKVKSIDKTSSYVYNRNNRKSECLNGRVDLPNRPNG